jgi:hypothetical protein
MSQSASGQFGGAMVFSDWKGRAYVRKLVMPSNPKTAAQTGVRAMMAFLAAAWKTITGASQGTFDAAAAAATISPFNAFVKANLKRWQNNLGPAQTAAAPATSTPLTLTAVAPVGGKGNIALSYTPSAATNLWGIAIFRDSVAITGVNWNKCIKVIPASTAAAVAYDDTTVSAGTYHYRACTVQIDGTLGTLVADATGTAT